MLLTLKRTFSVIIPKSDDNREFVEELKNAFRANYGQGITFVESADKKNEIVIISLINGFPLRYMSNLKYLKSKYDDRIAREDSETAKMFLYTEGNGMGLPNLFIPSQQDIDAEISKIQKNTIP